MKLLVDINVVLDVILLRQPWAADASALLSAIEVGRAEGYVAGHTITTAHYITAKEKGRQSAGIVIADLLRILQVVPVEGADFHHALVMGLADFEDAVQVAAGLKIGADYIVTRNEKDFRGALLEPKSAGEILMLL